MWWEGRQPGGTSALSLLFEFLKWKCDLTIQLITKNTEEKKAPEWLWVSEVWKPGSEPLPRTQSENPSTDSIQGMHRNLVPASSLSLHFLFRKAAGSAILSTLNAALRSSILTVSLCNNSFGFGDWEGKIWLKFFSKLKKEYFWHEVHTTLQVSNSKSENPVDPQNPQLEGHESGR